MQFRLTNSQRYLVVGLVGVGLPLTVTIRVSRVLVRRVWPSSLLARSRLRRAVTSQLGTQGRHVCCHTGVVPVVLSLVT